MCFIRGNSRSLPTGVLRRGRAKLARLLARHRAHSTLVVELITRWRERNTPLLALTEDDEDDDDTAIPDEISRLTLTRTQEHQQHERTRAVSSTMASAMAIAAKSGPPPAPRLMRRAEPSRMEPFLWMGVNYLLKMCNDMKYAPLPIPR